MKNLQIILSAVIFLTLAACGSNFEWFPDLPDNAKPTVSVTIGGQSVFTNNSSSSTTSVTATVSSFPAVVVFSANEPAMIYYTLNGADPTTASTYIDIPVAGGQVAGSDIIANNTTLKFFGIDKSYEQNRSAIQSILVSSSDTTDAIITVKIGTVTVDDSGTTKVAEAELPAQVVFSANEAAVVYYTSDGTTPTVNSPDYVDITSALTSVNGPKITTTGTTLKFISVDRSGNISSVLATTVSSDTTPATVKAIVSNDKELINRITADTNPATVKFTSNEPVTIYYTTGINNAITTPTIASTSVVVDGTPLEATGPVITVNNTILWFFGVDLAGNQSDPIIGTIELP